MGPDDSIQQNESVKEFINRYLAVKELGWVRSHRSNNTGIGKTLEDLMEIVENNIEGPDLGDVEIKSQRKLTSSKLTLFTKKPTGPDGANTVLRDKYGKQNPTHPECRFASSPRPRRACRTPDLAAPQTPALARPAAAGCTLPCPPCA